MDFKALFKGLIPHLTAIVFFLIIGFAYFPEVLDGKQLGGHDNANFKGQSRELVDFREETGEEALWSNNMFSGMPAYMTSVLYKGNKAAYLNRILMAGPRPVSFVFLYLIGFYILLLSFRVNPWLAIAGAIAFAFSSYNFVILAAGHNSKAIAIGYMAPVIAGVIMAFRGKKLLGMAIAGLAISLLFMAGHPQISYYTMIIILFYGASELYFAIREKQFKNLILSVAVLFVSLGLGLASNTARLWTSVEYGKYSMRSPSELTHNEEDQTSGLEKSYATAWSYGIDETLSLLIPGFKGGSSSGALTERSATYELFARSNPQQASQVIKHLPLYWGEQTSTMGNVYIGAIVVFLFILGMFIGDKRIKWWLLASSILGILLSWGHNFMGLTNFFMDHVPGYNKFRTVSMTLVIPALAMPLLALLTLNQLFFGEVERNKLLRAMKWSLGIAGGISLLFALFPDLAGNFVSAMDAQYQPQLAEALQADRRSLLRTDALRSLLFILAAAGTIYLFKLEKIKVNVAIALLGVLFLADMWPVNKRYLNEEHFSPARQAREPFTATPADQFIMQQEGENQRVLNLTVATWQDASTSYFHPSLGGYHGAKMRRYQDIIETGLQDDISRLYNGLRTQDYGIVDSTLASCNFLNLVNTRYIIVNPETQPIINRHAKGNAWFVDQVRVVENADEDIRAISGLDLESTCTLDKRYAEDLVKQSFTPDPLAGITLSDYSPKRMVYRSRSRSEQLAVFSEMYYPKGWTATIDGEETPHYRVNYLLRGMVVPAGEHEIIFQFSPESYFRGTMISTISSILLILLILGGVYMEFRKKEDQ